MEEDWLHRIKPGGRIGRMNRSIANVLNLISVGRTNAQIIAVYNELADEDIEACRLYDGKLKYVPNDKDSFEEAKNGLRPFSDFEWFAVDREGGIARFTSAGFGSIPQTVFRDFSTYVDLKKHLHDLPDITDPKIRVNVNYSLNDFIIISKKGIYAYDFDSESNRYKDRSYSLLTSPTQPLNVANLSDRHASYLNEIRFHKISFENEDEIIVENFFADLND